MWTKFNLDGMKFDIKVEKYIPNQPDDDNWVEVSFNFEFHDIIKYSSSKRELISSREIDGIMESMQNLLDGKIEKVEEYNCIEPDMTFIFNPEDTTMKLKITLWNGSPTCNYFSTSFERDEINQFYLYLSLITKKLGKEDIRIKKLLEAGTIYGNDE